MQTTCIYECACIRGVLRAFQCVCSCVYVYVCVLLYTGQYILYHDMCACGQCDLSLSNGGMATANSQLRASALCRCCRCSSEYYYYCCVKASEYCDRLRSNSSSRSACTESDVNLLLPLLVKRRLRLFDEQRCFQAQQQQQQQHLAQQRRHLQLQQLQQQQQRRSHCITHQQQRRPQQHQQHLPNQPHSLCKQQEQHLPKDQQLHKEQQLYKEQQLHKEHQLQKEQQLHKEHQLDKDHQLHKEQHLYKKEEHVQKKEPEQQVFLRAGGHDNDAVETRELLGHCLHAACRQHNTVAVRVLKNSKQQLFDGSDVSTLCAYGTPTKNRDLALLQQQQRAAAFLAAMHRRPHVVRRDCRSSNSGKSGSEGSSLFDYRQQKGQQHQRQPLTDLMQTNQVDHRVYIHPSSSSSPGFKKGARHSQQSFGNMVKQQGLPQERREEGRQYYPSCTPLQHTEARRLRHQRAATSSLIHQAHHAAAAAAAASTRSCGSAYEATLCMGERHAHTDDDSNSSFFSSERDDTYSWEHHRTAGGRGGSGGNALSYNTSTIQNSNMQSSSIRGRKYLEVYHFDAPMLAATAADCARQRVEDQQFWDAIVVRALQIVQLMEPRDMALLLNALSRMRKTSELLLRMLAPRVTQKLLYFNSVHLCMVLSAYGKGQVFDAPLLRALRQQLLHRLTLQELRGPLELAMLLNALAKLKVYESALFDRLALHVCERLHAETFHVRELAVIATAFSSVHHLNIRLFNSIAEASMETLSEATPLELARLLQSFCHVISLRPPAMMQEATTHTTAIYTAVTRTAARGANSRDQGHDLLLDEHHLQKKPQQQQRQGFIPPSFSVGVLSKPTATRYDASSMSTTGAAAIAGVMEPMLSVQQSADEHQEGLLELQHTLHALLEACLPHAREKIVFMDAAELVASAHAVGNALPIVTSPQLRKDVVLLLRDIRSLSVASLMLFSLQQLSLLLYTFSRWQLFFPIRELLQVVDRLAMLSPAVRERGRKQSACNSSSIESMNELESAAGSSCSKSFRFFLSRAAAATVTAAEEAAAAAQEAAVAAAQHAAAAGGGGLLDTTGGLHAVKNAHSPVAACITPSLNISFSAEYADAVARTSCLYSLGLFCVAHAINTCRQRTLLHARDTSNNSNSTSNSSSSSEKEAYNSNNRRGNSQSHTNSNSHTDSDSHIDSNSHHIDSNSGHIDSNSVHVNSHSHHIDSNSGHIDSHSSHINSNSGHIDSNSYSERMSCTERNNCVESTTCSEKGARCIDTSVRRGKPNRSSNSSSNCSFTSPSSNHNKVMTFEGKGETDTVSLDIMIDICEDEKRLRQATRWLLHAWLPHITAAIYVQHAREKAYKEAAAVLARSSTSSSSFSSSSTTATPSSSFSSSSPPPPAPPPTAAAAAVATTTGGSKIQQVVRLVETFSNTRSDDKEILKKDVVLLLQCLQPLLLLLHNEVDSSAATILQQCLAAAGVKGDEDVMLLLQQKAPTRRAPLSPKHIAHISRANA